MARALRGWAISEREKTRSVTYSTDRENEVSKRYLLHTCTYVDLFSAKFDDHSVKFVKLSFVHKILVLLTELVNVN